MQLFYFRKQIKGKNIDAYGSRDPIFIYLLFGGGGKKYLHNRESQIHTWVKNVTSPSEVIYMCGDPSVREAYLEGPILNLPISEDYENGLERQLLALKWTLENRNFDWLVFSNTSNYFKHSALTNYVISNPSLSVAAVCGNWEVPGSETLIFPSGAGTLMSFEIAKSLTEFPVNIYKEIPNDVAIGKLLSHQKINIEPMKRVDLTDWNFFEEHFHYRVKHWRFHKVTSFRMKMLYRIEKSNRSFKFFWIKVLNLSQIILGLIDGILRTLLRPWHATRLRVIKK